MVPDTRVLAVGRGQLLLRRVLAGSGHEPGPGWGVSADGTGPGGLGAAGPWHVGPAGAVPMGDGAPGDGLSDGGPLRHAVRLPARAGVTAGWPDWVPAQVREAFVRQGVRAPWSLSLIHI